MPIERLLWLAFGSLVAVLVLLLGTFQAVLTFRQNTHQAATLQLAQNELSGDRVGASMLTTSSLVLQMSTQAYLQTDSVSRRAELYRLLAVDATIRSVELENIVTKETLTISRIGPDEARLSRTGIPVVPESTAQGELVFGDVYYEANVSPIVAFSMRRTNAFVVRGEISLGALTEAVFALKVGKNVSAYIVDSKDIVVADRNFARALNHGKVPAVQPFEDWFMGAVLGRLPVKSWIGKSESEGAVLVSAADIPTLLGV